MDPIVKRLMENHNKRLCEAYKVRYSYEGDELSDYEGNLIVVADSEDDAIEKAKKEKPDGWNFRIDGEISSLGEYEKKFPHSNIPILESNHNSLYNQISNKVTEIMTSPEFGFSEDEVDDYSVVEIVPHQDGTIQVQVRAEISYDGMDTLANALNPIVQKYDKDSYFDHVTSGVIEAYIEN